MGLRKVSRPFLGMWWEGKRWQGLGLSHLFASCCQLGGSSKSSLRPCSHEMGIPQPLVSSGNSNTRNAVMGEVQDGFTDAHDL